METQKITLALRKISNQGHCRQRNLPDLLTKALGELVAREEVHRAAGRRNLRALDSAHDLGTKGKRTWTRDELHER
jgi:hypothetical protein